MTTAHTRRTAHANPRNRRIPRKRFSPTKVARRPGRSTLVPLDPMGRCRVDLAVSAEAELAEEAAHFVCQLFGCVEVHVVSGLGEGQGLAFLERVREPGDVVFIEVA